MSATTVRIRHNRLHGSQASGQQAQPIAGRARRAYLAAADLISWRLEVRQDLLLVELADVHQVIRVRRSHCRCSATHLHRT